MRFKRWKRVLTRLAKTRNPAKALRQWASEPARTVRKYRRVSALVRFGRNRAESLPPGSKQAKRWREWVAGWAQWKERLRKQMEADLGSRRIIPRWEWDANPGDRASASMSNESEGLFDHHSVAGSPSTQEGEKAEMRNLKAIARSRGFADFSYSYGIAPSGRIYEGRGRGIEGAHTIGFNDTAHAAVAMGNYESQHPTDAMLDSFRWLAQHLAASKVRPHRSVSATSCPGQNIVNALF